MVSNMDPPREEIMPTKIKEVLKEWECTWMWKSLRLVGIAEWIKDTIRRLESSCCHRWIIHKGKVSTYLLGGLHSQVQQRKRAGVRFLSGVFSRCEHVSGIIDGSNGNTFDSIGSEQILADSKRTGVDIFRLS